MGEQLFQNIRTADGRVWNILIYDYFTVEMYPNRQYVAYTFGESNEGYPKAYISVVTMVGDGDSFNFEPITDQTENNIVREAFINLEKLKLSNLNVE